MLGSGNNISRRNFLAGSAAIMATLGLSGCAGGSSSKKNTNTIYATLAYAGTNCNPVGNTNALFVAAG